MRLPVFDKNGKRTQEILEIDEKIFGEEVREVLLKEFVLMHEARQRVGTHSTKARAECAGSGRKLWRQKGTGRARVGPARAPHWRGGGVVFGPKPRDYSYSMPKKARRKALDSAWLAKLLDREIMVIEEFDASEPKTAKMVRLLQEMGIADERVVIGISQQQPNLWLSVRNLPKVSLDVISRFNAHTLLANDKIVVEKKAFQELVESHKGKVQSLERDKVYAKSS